MKIKFKVGKAGLDTVIAGFVLAALPVTAFAIGGGNGTAVPEPDTILLMGLGAAAIWVARRIKK